MPGDGQYTLTAEQVVRILGSQQKVSVTLSCSHGQNSVEQTLLVPVARLLSFKANRNTAKAKDTITLSWSTQGIPKSCSIDGTEVKGDAKTLQIEDQPKTIRTFKLSCPGYKKIFEQEIKLYILPDNNLVWYLASDFSLNGKPIDDKLNDDLWLIGDESALLTFKAGAGVSCSAQDGLGEKAEALVLVSDHDLKTLTIGELKDSTLVIRCEAAGSDFPQTTTSIYLSIERRTAQVGAISLSTLISRDFSEGYDNPNPVFADDTFHLYANLQNIAPKSCKIGFDGEEGSQLVGFWPSRVQISDISYKKPAGTLKGWISCELSEGVFRKAFDVKIQDPSKQICPEEFIKIYDMSQLSLPAACPKVSRVLMAFDSIAWEKSRVTQTPLTIKLADGQSFFGNYNSDVIHYAGGTRVNSAIEQRLFTYGYLHNNDSTKPLNVLIESGPSGQLKSLNFGLAERLKVTSKGLKILTHDLVIKSSEKSEFSFPGLQAAGLLKGTGNRQVKAFVPDLKKITGRSEGDLLDDEPRNRPIIGGVYLGYNISLLVVASLESVTGAFAVLENPGEVSLVEPGTHAVGVIQQPLKEILKAERPLDQKPLLQRLNGSLLISENEVLQKIDLHQLSQVADGAVIGHFEKLDLETEYVHDENSFNSDENSRLSEIDLSQLARHWDIYPEETVLNLEHLKEKEGFDQKLYLIRNHNLDSLKLGTP